MTKAVELFPLEEPRATQARVIEEIEKVFANGYRYVLLEAPVGSGKSAIAITFARLFGQSHIITPRKSLQNQYYSDFSEHLVLMKGRKAYPCTYPDYAAYNYNRVIADIKEGRVKEPGLNEPNCGDAPCLDDREVYKYCTQHEECPYHVAIEVAQNNAHVIHNMHSFIFQTSFSNRFEERDILIVDECHEIENTLRTFITRSFTIKKFISDIDKVKYDTIDEWCGWLSQPSILELYSNKKEGDHAESERDKFIDRIEVLRSYKDTYSKGFVVKAEANPVYRQTKIEFIPVHIGNAANTFLFKYGKKVLLMSGTIYSKEMYCKSLGIDSSQVYFLRVGSSFPVESRPIYLKSEYMVDTSHAQWTENFGKMVEIIKTVMGKFPDVKGLVHVPSYMSGTQLALAIKDKRIITHDKHDFLTKLEKFFQASGNGVFVSPVCQQGVDFKDDRARFQIIVRVPYSNTADPFIEHKVKTDYPWYNYQALVTFGQQIGRINRSDSDFGATVLMDSRFEKFLSKNKKMIPGWVKESIVKG